MFLVVGNTCSDPALSGILSSVKGILLLIQIIVPIMLIVWSMYQLFLLMQNPDMKNGVKNIINKFIAAVVVFMIPVLLNVIFSLAGESTNFSSCWNNASDTVQTGGSYQDPSDTKNKIPINPNANDYE